jgi:hypothetical protein
MSDRADSAPLSLDERFHEIAAILAAAIVRLHERVALPPTGKTGELPPESLEVPAKTVLSVLTGQRFRDLKPKSNLWT